MQIRIPALVVASALLIPGVAVAQEVPVEALRRAAQKGLALLESTSPTFIQKGGCNSCHNQKLAAAAQAFARQRGIPTGPTIAQLPDELSDATAERFVEYAQGGGSGISGLGYELFARAMTNEPGDARVQAQLYYLKSMQRTDGSWGLVGNRPPITFDDVTATAFVDQSAECVCASGARCRHTPKDRSRSRMVASGAATVDTGTRVSSVGTDVVEGGCRCDQTSDFSSAEASADRRWLVSASGHVERCVRDRNGALLDVAGRDLPVKDAVYQKGLRYLLDTQAADGTWHVRTRSLPFQPYFETGYPDDHDQWISAAGAAYATMAITAAVEPSRRAGR